MVLPPIPPLPHDVWMEFVAALRRGPSPEQVRAVERAEELVRDVTVRDSSTMKNVRRLDPAEVARRMEEQFAAEAAARKAGGAAARTAAGSI